MSDVPARPDPAAYLDQVAASMPGRAYKREVLELLDLRPGQTAVDLGCGPGTDLAAMATALAPTGTVIGIDHDPAMIARARDRLAGTPAVEFRPGDIHALPLGDRSVDRARTDRVLQHVTDPRQVLAEFRRVARPSARIVMAEPDWDGLLIDTPDPAIGRALARFITIEVVRNSTIGRALPRLCEDTSLNVRSVRVATPLFRDFPAAEQILGLRRNTIRAIDAGYLTPAAADWTVQAAAGPFLATAPLFLVTAETLD